MTSDTTPTAPAREEITSGFPEAGAPRFESIDAVRAGLAEVQYLADDGISGVVYLADRLAKPVLVEGPAGTGKTELAKSVARLTGSRLIRLQCYEGLDESKALYEWNYKKQLLRIQADSGQSWKELEDDIFSEEFLLTRPLLEAIKSTEPVVLLIDEIDRVELETEALLLEILSEYQVSIPELGTVRASQIPWSSSRPTTPGNCPRPSSAAASTCTSTIPNSSGSGPSSRPGCRASARPWPTRWPASCGRSARST